MANKTKKNSEYNEYYSHILIDRTKRAGFIIVFGLVFTGLVYVIATNMHYERSWMVIVAPVLLVGLPMMFYPPVEKWVYKPWQAKAQKYERYYRE